MTDEDGLWLLSGWFLADGGRFGDRPNVQIQKGEFQLHRHYERHFLEHEVGIMTTLDIFSDGVLVGIQYYIYIILNNRCISPQHMHYSPPS